MKYNYEVEEKPDGSRRMLHYIGGEAGTAAVYVLHSTGEDTLYSVFTDHLGSWKTVVSETDGQIYRQSFDAWGRKRNPQNWNSSVSSAFPFDRGYTGHQHLDEFGLINMNGRMYDVGLCRFLSPDPYVQAPDFTQNFNRYSYCLNNPLVYTDPSGEEIVTLLIAAGVGALISGATYTASVAMSDGGFDNWDWGQLGVSMGIGALSGFITAGIGSVYTSIGSGGLVGEVAQAYTHGFFQGIISDMTGGEFMHGFASGGLGSLGASAFSNYFPDAAGHVIGQVGFSAVAGGIGAELSGGEFWQGAVTGATVSLLNHYLHRAMNGKPQGEHKVFKSLDEMLEYIYWETDKRGIEMGALVLKFVKNGNISYEYYVYPHNENDQTTALHDNKIAIGDRYFDAEEKYLFHTHNSDVSPSYEDYANTGFSGINKSFVLTKSYMYRVTSAACRYPAKVYNPYRNQNPPNYWTGRIPLSFI